MEEVQAVTRYQEVTMEEVKGISIDKEQENTLTAMIKVSVEDEHAMER